ncbi:MAG: Crp/Fnr family transcriptional regulator [Akkermansiaceae bacterium]
MQISNELYAKISETVEFFESFTPGELLSLLQIAESTDFAEGDVVFEEGSKSDNMYIIKAGSVSISHSINGKEEVLGEAGVGECFGEMGAVDEAPRSATVTVVNGPATILSISSGVLSEKNKDVALKFFQSFAKVLSGRLRELNKKS